MHGVNNFFNDMHNLVLLYIFRSILSQKQTLTLPLHRIFVFLLAKMMGHNKRSGGRIMRLGVR